MNDKSKKFVKSKFENKGKKIERKIKKSLTSTDLNFDNTKKILVKNGENIANQNDFTFDAKNNNDEVKKFTFENEDNEKIIDNNKKIENLAVKKSSFNDKKSGLKKNNKIQNEKKKIN